MLFDDAVKDIAASCRTVPELTGSWTTFENVRHTHECRSGNTPGETLWVGPYTPELARLAHTTPFLLVGPAPEAFAQSHPHRVELEDAAAADSVFSRLSEACLAEALAEKRAVRRLMQLISSGCSPQDLANEIAAVLENPVVVQDASFRLLAYCDYGARDYLMFTTYIRDGAFTDTFIDASYRYRVDRRSYRSNHPNGTHVELCPNTQTPTLSGKVLIGGTEAASFMMPAAVTPVNGMHFRLFPLIAECLSIFLQKAEEFARSYSCKEERLIYDLIHLPDAAEVDAFTARIAKMPDVHLPALMCPILIEAHAAGTIVGNTQLASRFRRTIKDSYVIPFSAYILVVVAVENEHYVHDLLAQPDVLAILEESDLFLYVGAPFSQISALYANYADAVSAMNTVHTLHIAREKPWIDVATVAHFDLVKNQPAPALERACHPALGVLRAHDSAHGTELFRTLRAYVTNRGNLTAIAQELHCHKNTVIYRMRKVQELTGVDLHDVWTLLALVESFAISRFLPPQ